ncbi:MAG: signal peptidase I [Candidatus Bathyarchaeia archaeon]
MKIFQIIKKSETIKLLILVALMFIAVQGGMYLLKMTLNTDIPLAYVPSKSMEPTLNVGDLVLIQGIDPHEIKNGTIIVFYVPGHYGEDSYRIVHRVIKTLKINNQIMFETKGDNNPVSDFIRWKYIPADHVIGKVFLKIPYLGYIALFKENFLGSNFGTVVIIAILALLLIILEFSSDIEKGDKKNHKRWCLYT